MRKLLSQNFLWSRELVGKLIGNSSITRSDLVVEIGPGTGIITAQLLERGGKLIAVEADENLFKLLRERFSDDPRITLVREDFLKYQPPKENYKIFSNPPFSITGEIIKKLVFSQNPPVDSYLVLQNEAAEKYMTRRSGNTMLAILFYPWFEIGIIYEFLRKDFQPTLHSTSKCNSRLFFLSVFSKLVTVNFFFKGLVGSKVIETFSGGVV